MCCLPALHMSCCLPARLPLNWDVCRRLVQGLGGRRSCSSSISSKYGGILRQQQHLAGSYCALQLVPLVCSAAGDHAAAGRGPVGASSSNGLGLKQLLLAVVMYAHVAVRLVANYLRNSWHLCKASGSRCSFRVMPVVLGCLLPVVLGVLWSGCRGSQEVVSQLVMLYESHMYTKCLAGVRFQFDIYLLEVEFGSRGYYNLLFLDLLCMVQPASPLHCAACNVLCQLRAVCPALNSFGMHGEHISCMHSCQTHSRWLAAEQGVCTGHCHEQQHDSPSVGLVYAWCCCTLLHHKGWSIVTIHEVTRWAIAVSCVAVCLAYPCSTQAGVWMCAKSLVVWQRCGICCLAQSPAGFLCQRST